MFIRSGDKKDAFTLVEMLVAASLALILLSVVVQVLIPSLQASRKATTRMDLHQKALILNQFLEEDLKRATRSSVQFFSGVLSVHRRTTETARILWEEQIIAYEYAGGRLKRWEEPLQESPPKPTTATLPPSGRLRLDIGSVEAFQAEVGDGPLVSFEIQFVEGSEEFDWKRTMFLPTSSH